MATAARNTGLDSVSCASATDCEAVGISIRPPGVVAELWNGKKWFVQHGPAAPAGSEDADLSGVSCISPVNCVAVGRYDQPNSGSFLLAFRYS